MNLFSLLEASARRFRAEPAMFAGNRRHATFAELEDRALALGGALRERGAAGDRVLLASGNCPEYVEAMFAIWAAGMVAVPVNAKLHPREMEEIAHDGGATAAFVSREIAAKIALPGAVAIGSDGYRAMLGHAAVAPAEVEPDDLAWLFFTSGTTGRSKGAMLSHRNLLAMAIAHRADFEAIGPGDCLVHAAPMSHGSGLYMLPYVMVGARQVIPASGGFDPAELLDLADEHRGAGAFLAPTMLRRLRLHMVETGRRHSLRSIVYGGGPLHVAELKESLAAFGPILTQLYGQGECPMTITGLLRDQHDAASDEVLASAGWPRSGVEVRILDEAGEMLSPGEVGEIVCRSDIVMRGYWRNPAATEAALRGGWLHTGDMGSIDECGMLTLRDRSKDVIISGGSNIYPREVEDALTGHPAVAEACVFGASDADWGEIVVAAVVREPGGEVGEDELDRHCLARIARFKRPKRYLFLPELPKSSYGKVLKREVALLYER